MPVLERPDGVELHYEPRGEGPLVLMAPHFFAPPAVYDRLAAGLASDHRVVTYDPRGTGSSTWRAPVDVEEDAEDLAAVAMACGGGGVAIGWGDGYRRAAIAAVHHPDAVRAVVSAGAAMVSRLDQAEGAGASRAVYEAFLRLGAVNYRAALRGHLLLTNPDLSEDELRARLNAAIGYSDADAALRRAAWHADSRLHEAVALGSRLWVIHWESALSPAEFANALARVLPEAHFEFLAEGAISRPDLTADVVRRAVAAAEKAA